MLPDKDHWLGITALDYCMYTTVELRTVAGKGGWLQMEKDNMHGDGKVAGKVSMEHRDNTSSLSG